MYLDLKLTKSRILANKVFGLGGGIIKPFRPYGITTPSDQNSIGGVNIQRAQPVIYLQELVKGVVFSATAGPLIGFKKFFYTFAL